MKINITLTHEDKEFAEKWGLTDDEMKGFIEDMAIADELERDAIREAERRRAEMLATPQGSVYDAW